MNFMELNERKLEDILKEQREEYQRYMGILTEDFNAKVELIAEQYASIKEALASHTEMIVSVKENIGSIQGTLGYHTEMIASTKEDIEIMKVDVAFIKAGLKKKVDTEEFESLERRVVLLEAKMKA